jgi:hypothetical protein
LTYQSLILAASGNKNTVNDFSKCHFLVSHEINLMNAAILTNETAANIVMALDPEEYKLLESSRLRHSTSLVEIKNRTKGALATSGMCLDKLNDELPIVIQSVDGLCFNLMKDFVQEMQNENADGGVIVFHSDNPTYSYVRVSGNTPIEFAEKQLIGDLATAGIFYFRSKELLIDSILWAILFQIRFMDKYYLSSAMNKLVFEGKKVSLFKISEDSYFRFATEPEALEARTRLGNRSHG